MPCQIQQYRGRDYTDPAYEISVQATEDRGLLKFFLDVGRIPGGTDVLYNRQLGGSLLVSTTVLRSLLIDQR